MGGISKPRRKSDPELLSRVRSMPCAICMRSDSDAHHIRSVGSGGDDEEWNVHPLCRCHHSEWHSLGWMKFLRKYPKFASLLRRNDWQVEETQMMDGSTQARLYNPRCSRVP